METMGQCGVPEYAFEVGLSDKALVLSFRLRCGSLQSAAPTTVKLLPSRVRRSVSGSRFILKTRWEQIVAATSSVHI